MTTIQCIKVGALRKVTGDPDMNLEKWMSNSNNVYVGRHGRINIHSKEGMKVFHYSGSKFANPFKVGDYTLEESIKLYEEHLRSNLLTYIEELKGKNLGCWCDQSGPCHAKILLKYIN